VGTVAWPKAGEAAQEMQATIKAKIFMDPLQR
jgi:hypothetical protein